MRGFKPKDVDTAADDANVVSSKMLGSGVASTTYLLTTNTGAELVFKPELDGRLGLNRLNLSDGGAYLDTQNAANLNLATQDTAKAFGCEDVVVKYSVGSHDGQFGIFMEKAKGLPGSTLVENTSGDQLSQEDKTKIKGSIAQQLNKLMWLDLITGQGDRHHNNYFVHIDPKTREATVKGIDNDASFSATRIGLQKYKLDKDRTKYFDEILKEICQSLHGGLGEYGRRLSKDPAIVRNDDGTMTVDLTEAKSPEVKMALCNVVGMQSFALPEEIDEDFYNVLMDMDEHSTKMDAYINTISPRVSPDALEATKTRLKEAIALAKDLKGKNKVYSKKQWQSEKTLNAMTSRADKLTIEKSNGETRDFDNTNGLVDRYNRLNCPSYFKNEYLERLFENPS